MDSIKVSNIQPTDITSLQVHIPPSEPFYTQNFSNMLSLDPAKFNYISRVSVIVDTAGIYNIPKDEILSLAIYNTGGIYTHTNIYFKPGNYTISNIIEKINNSTNTTDPSIRINRSGEYSYRTQLLFDSNKNKQVSGWDFTDAKTLQYILGLSIQNHPEINTFNKGSTEHIDKNILWYVPTYISPNVVDTTAGFDTIFVACDLVKQSTLIGQNYLITASINVNPGEILVYTQRCNIPLSKLNFSNINWKLTNRLGIPYSVLTPVDIFIEILTQDK